MNELWMNEPMFDWLSALMTGFTAHQNQMMLQKRMLCWPLRVKASAQQATQAGQLDDGLRTASASVLAKELTVPSTSRRSS